MPRFALNQTHVESRVHALDDNIDMIPADHSYHRCYPAMVAMFVDRPLTEDLLIQGAHMVYGWMQTIVEVDLDAAPGAIAALEALRRADDTGLQLAEWLSVKSFVNNSFVGASKLAHFIAPERVAIWDSNIAAFLVRGYSSTSDAALQARAQSTNSFLAYQRGMRAIRGTPRARTARANVSERLGYPVSELRAVEVQMFHAD